MLKLYTAEICPFAHRCRLALRLADLPHERGEIDLASMPDWYRQLSPTGNVPLLQHDDHILWESAIINEYLAEAFPHAPLQPAEAWKRARSRLAVDWAGNHLIPGFYQVLRNQEQATEKLTQALLDGPRWMSEEGPFWLGQQPLLVDLAIYPWFERWPVLAHYRGWDQPFPPRVQQWLDAMRAHPVVQAEAGPVELFVRGYARYAN